MSSFTDHFSRQSGIYLQYRPGYPAELFAYLRSLTGQHEMAWDCGTGNGQAAVSLAEYYASVYATDPSESQIAHAIPCKNVVYRVEKAEHSGLADHSADLVTVAQAVHWFDFDTFYTEVKRVLKPGGVIAVWAYGLPLISAGIDVVLQHFHDITVGECWQEENRLIDRKYATIPFPFGEISPPDFVIRRAFSRDDLLGLVSSWSAVQKYKDRYGKDPVEELEQSLLPLWENGDHKKEVTWKLILKVGWNSEK